MTFTTPIPFLDALEKLRRKEVLPSSFDTDLWRRVEVGVRERAFFSARVESARVLGGMQDYLDDYLANARMDHGGLRAQGRAEFVAQMRELAIREGLGKVAPETGEIDPNIVESDLTDIRSISRLELIFDTQTEAANEYGYWREGQDPDILDVWPAQRFIRVRPVAAPRPYHEAALGTVRRKDDLKFWLSMNRDFGVPWGPWGFNSGCGVEDVDREEAEELGVIQKNEVVKPVEKEFNDGLEAGILSMDERMLAALVRSTGGTVAGGALSFRSPELPLPRGGSVEVPEALQQRMVQTMRETGEIQGGFEDLDMMTAEGAAFVRGFENRVARERLEHLKVWTAEGSQTWSEVGTENEVSGPEGNALKGRIASHNHPGGRPFSFEDVSKLLTWKMAETRVAAGDWIHVARTGDMERRMELPMRWESLVQQAAAVSREEARVIGQVPEGWREEATLTAVLAELDQMGIIQYKRIKRP